MPNPIKYSTTSETLALKKGNFYIGTNDVGKGPTSSTGYWNGITPPSGGYTIYTDKLIEGPSIFVASSDEQLIKFTNGFSSQNFTTVTQCLNWYATQTNYICLNKNYERIVTNGLVLNFDASFTASYPGIDSTWYDISGSNNGTLINGVSFSPEVGGCIVFDGVNAYVNFDNPLDQSQLNQVWTVQAWINITSKPPQTLINGLNQNLWIEYYQGNNSLLYLNSGIDDYYTYGGQFTSQGWVLATFRFNNSNGDRQIIRDLSNISTGGPNNTFIPAGQQITFSIGTSNSNTILGKISNVLFYNRYLTDNELTQNYNAGLSRFNTANIVKDELMLNLDSTNYISYPTTGTSWKDLSGFGNSYTLYNGPTFDATSKAIVFDGTNDYATTTPSTYGITNQFTIEVLCNPTQSLPTGMFNFYGGVQDRGIMCHWPWVDGNIYFDIYNTSGAFHRWYKTIDILNQIALYHIILTPSGQMVVKQNNVVLSPNGSSTFTGNVSLGISNVIGAFSVGGGNAWKGNMYKFRVYNRALSDTETSQNYYQNNLITSNISHRWDFSNLVSYPSSGTAVKNLTGNVNATLVNGPTYNSQFGGYVSFDGSDDYMSLIGGNYAITLGDGNSPWTVNAWVRTTTTADGLGQGSVMSNSNGGPVYSMFGVNGGKIVYWVYPSNINGWKSFKGTKPINDGNWHLLTWVQNVGYSMNMYVDGILDVTVSPTNAGNNNPIDIIGGSWAGRFNGDIGEIQINTTAFSSDQVSQQYTSTKSRYEVPLGLVTNGLILHWDPANTNSYPGSGTIIYDLSGNNNHGTLYNGVGFSSDNGGVLTFDGTNDYVYGGPNMSSSNYTLMGVARYVTISGRIIAGGNNWLLGHWAGYTNDHYAEGWVYYNPSIQNTNWAIYAGSGDITGDLYNFYMNNVLLASNNGGSQGPNSISLGAGGGSYEFSNAQVGPILLYNRVLTQAELTQNYNYLKSRFGL